MIDSSSTIHRISGYLGSCTHQEPKLTPIPKGSGEQWEQLCKSIRKRNQWTLYPDGQD